MTDSPSRAELIEALRALAAELGGTPTRKQMNEHGRYSSQPFYTEFGSWNASLEAANLTTNHENDIDNEALLAELRRLDDELDRTPRFDDMAEHGAYSPHTYVRRWNSWPDAKAAAGLDPATRTSRRISEEELIDAIRELALELGKPPTQREMNEFGRYSHRAYYRAFSGWGDALRAASFDPEEAHERGIPDEELIEAVRELADELGRTPTFEDMNERGRYSVWPYLRRWTSWNESVRAAGLTINKRWGEADGPINYGADWPTQRERALEHYDYECQECGISDERNRRERGEGLHVHHIKRFHSFEDHREANRLANLIPLCRQCHAEWEAAGGIPDGVTLDGE